ncbi:hypothetical protein NE237_009615 [Protea cynaroides]|uniref:Uncharacterized protein n=1 Tax=Protea cynaroides TaxID=273540 RepID=A0A9Q0R0G0_9MAGN|nr:hypothetical protein NE237_009615 [Protea cynaroides]
MLSDEISQAMALWSGTAATAFASANFSWQMLQIEGLAPEVPPWTDHHLTYRVRASHNVNGEARDEEGKVDDDADEVVLEMLNYEKEIGVRLQYVADACEDAERAREEALSKLNGKDAEIASLFAGKAMLSSKVASLRQHQEEEKLRVTTEIDIWKKANEASQA